MITIPIWLFVIIVTLSTIFLLIIVVTIIGYIKYCHYNDKLIDKQIRDRYGNGD